MLYNTALAVEQAGYDLACVVTAHPAPEYERGLQDFVHLANERGIPIGISTNVDSVMDIIMESECDIGISVNYPAIIPQSVIKLFPLGILNAHGGDLPRYRGNACQAWAILNGEDRIGLCVHKMVGGQLDSGDIIARDYYVLTDRTKIGEVLNWMSDRVPDLMSEALLHLQRDPSYVLEVQSSDSADVLRCYPRRPEDSRIDWNQSPIDIVRLVNASGPPYQGAFCFLGGKKIIVFDAVVVNDNEMFCAVPGQIVSVQEFGVDVASREGKVRLLQYEFAEPSDNLTLRSVRQRLT
jgi:UDP-4-amino-4-deoxy-L-arabinose formyltransferase/UDP-glucuronic acid dehydrogenase (UDP-4-keto-hexauronic acid decarboxylating)